MIHRKFQEISPFSLGCPITFLSDNVSISGFILASSLTTPLSDKSDLPLVCFPAERTHNGIIPRGSNLMYLVQRQVRGSSVDSMRYPKKKMRCHENFEIENIIKKNCGPNFVKMSWKKVRRHDNDVISINLDEKSMKFHGKLTRDDDASDRSRSHWIFWEIYTRTVKRTEILRNAYKCQTTTLIQIQKYSVYLWEFQKKLLSY